MEDSRKIQKAYEIYQIAGYRALLFAISQNITRDSRSDFARRHIRCLHERESLRVAEVGVWKGDHAKTLQRQLDVEKMYLIDPYDAYEDYEESKSEVEKMRSAKKEAHNKLDPYDNVEWIELYSHQAAQQINEQLDYVYIDGNHEYDYVKQDIEMFYELVIPGGIVAGHDFSTSWPGVIQAVMEFADEEGDEVSTESFGSDWFLKKPSVHPSLVKPHTSVV